MLGLHANITAMYVEKNLSSIVPKILCAVVQNAKQYTAETFTEKKTIVNWKKFHALSVAIYTTNGKITALPIKHAAKSYAWKNINRGK
jgi:hypothetical protein